jgi:peptidoglycan/LPS O-acetylase OafA/YrhL
LAVVIFFAISGFLVTPGLLRTANVVDYAVHRSVRIFPGLIVNVVLTILVLGPILTTHSLVSYFRDPQTYLYAKNILTLMVNYLPGVVASDGNPASINGALWTLHFEVLCYILLGLFGAFGLLSVASRFGVVVRVLCHLYRRRDKSAIRRRFIRLFDILSLFVFRMRRSAVPISRAFRSPRLACAALALLLGALPLGGGPVVMPICLPYPTMFCGLSACLGRCPKA